MTEQRAVERPIEPSPTNRDGIDDVTPELEGTIRTLGPRRGTKIYFASTIVAQVCALARYTLLARLLGPTQLGLAATLILTAQFFDSITNSGGDRFLISSREGDKPAVQHLVQAIAVGRGVLTALALVLFARPIAYLFGEPQLVGGFIGLACVPLLMGLIHFDLRRTQRHNDFRNEGWAMLLGESFGLVATAVTAFIVRDFSAIIYGLGVRTATMVLVSHALAGRRYRLGLPREHMRVLAAFSLPLMLNGLLLFFGSQGDRVVIGHSLGTTALGHYSAILLLVMYPSAMLQRFIAGAYLPRIAAARETPGELAKASDSIAGVTLALALLMAGGFALVGPTAITLLYGARFRETALIVALVGLLQAIRFLRLWPGTEAMASGHTMIVMVGNVSRMIGLAAGLGVIALGAGLAELLLCFIAGEMLSLGMSVVQVNRVNGRHTLREFGRIACFTAIGVMIIVCGALAARHLWRGFGIAAALLAAQFGLVLLRERGPLEAALAGMRGSLGGRSPA